MGNTTRRKLILSFLGILGVAGITAWFKKNSIIRWMFQRVDNANLKISFPPKLEDNLCVLTSSQVEGPFFISSPIRHDIKEDRQGKEMNLRMQIVRVPDCTPIAGAVVEIWHCDAEGVYSGYPDDGAHDPWATLKFVGLAGLTGENVKPINDARFLRGAQESGTKGYVEFNTIFPGWYEPRAPHIHFKVIINNKEQLTSQFYFEQELCDRLYTSLEPYTKYGKSPYNIHNDIVLKGMTQLDGLLLKPTWNGDYSLEASAKIGIKKFF